MGKKLRLLPVLLGAVLIALFGGCRTSAPPPAAAPPDPGRECAERLVRALTTDDYRSVPPLLAPTAAETLTPENFAALTAQLRKLGELRSVEFVTRLELPVFRAYVWKLRFETERPGQSPRVHEKLLHLIVGNPDARCQVFGLSLQ